MPQQLNLTNNPNITTEYQIEGVTLNIETRWNDRSKNWFISFYDNEGNEILSSVKLLREEGRNLTYRNRVSSQLDDYFTGNFYQLPTGNNVIELTLDNLGVDWDVYYITADEEDELIQLTQE